MKSAYEIALELAESFEQPTTMSETMEQANFYYEQLRPNNWDKPFLTKDIQFVKFFELMNMSNREQDLLYVATFLQPAFVTLHVTIMAMGEQPSPNAMNELMKTYLALQRLGAPHILLNGMPLNQFKGILEDNV